MAIAYKCDCCHKCFDPIDAPDKEFIKLNACYIFKGKDTVTVGKGGKFEEYLDHIDLCENCSDKFIKLLKSNNKQENKKNEEKSENVDDSLNDFHIAFDAFLKDIGSRGTAILRDFVHGNSNSETSEREGESKQDSPD